MFCTAKQGVAHITLDKQFFCCLCSNRFTMKKKKRKWDAQHCKKRKKSQNANKNSKVIKDLTLQQTTAPMVLVRGSCHCVWCRGASSGNNNKGQSTASKKRLCAGRLKEEEEKQQQQQPCCFGPFHRPDCTAHCIALAIGSSVYLYTSTGTGMAHNALAEFSYKGMSLYTAEHVATGDYVSSAS